jgi:beta-fructofuranosidase
MALKLPGQWVWDSWFAFDGENHHAFYLQASRALGDPNRRHRNTSVGHAISKDLKNWTVVADAIAPSESPAPDSWTTWTGSVIREENGQWRMFYTGTSREDAGQRQTVCAATSDDLMTWTKVEKLPVVAADPRWYKTLDGGFHNEPFRDPWVFKMAGESGWTMLTTAELKSSTDPRQAAAMAIAKSDDLINWVVQPPKSLPDQGFGETEVFQYELVDGVPIILFCCGPIWLSEERKAAGEVGGVYSIPVREDLEDINFENATLFPDTSLYASRLVQDRDGGWNLIAFVNEIDGEFIGELCDPIPVTADPILGLVPKAETGAI